MKCPLRLLRVFLLRTPRPPGSTVLSGTSIQRRNLTDSIFRLPLCRSNPPLSLIHGSPLRTHTSPKLLLPPGLRGAAV